MSQAAANSKPSARDSGTAVANGGWLRRLVRREREICSQHKQKTKDEKMNTETGQIKPWKEVEKLPPTERAKYVEVKRDLTKLEEANRQLKMYAPCGCGSGKKFKFCCHNKPKAPNTQLSGGTSAPTPVKL